MGVQLPDVNTDPKGWFQVVDLDGDGKLSRGEVIRALNATLQLDNRKTEKLIEDGTFWSKWDKDGSGHIEFREIEEIQMSLCRPEFGRQMEVAIPDIMQDKIAWFNYW